MLFIDGRKLGRMVDRTHRELTDEDIARIASTYHAWRGEQDAGEYADVPGFCKSATLGEIRAPTLVVWGADDPMMPVECAAAFRSGIPGARALLLPRAGHLPMITRPDEFNRALRAFLAGEAVGE